MNNSFTVSCLFLCSPGVRSLAVLLTWALQEQHGEEIASMWWAEHEQHLRALGQHKNHSTVLWGLFCCIIITPVWRYVTAQLSTPQPPHCWYALWGWHSTERQKCQEYSGVTKLPPHPLQQQPGVWEILCPQRPQTDTLDRELYMKWPTMLEMVLCSTIKKWSALSRQTDASFPPQGK